MHSAFLLTEDGWKFSTDFAQTLNHTGDLLVNENTEDRDDNLALLGAREGQIASLRGNTVVFSPTTIHNNAEDALADIETFGEGRCWYASYFESVTLPKKGGEYAIFGMREFWTDTRISELHDKFDGVVAISEGSFRRLVRDEQLWAQCVAERDLQKRKAHKRELKRPPSAHEFANTTYALAIGCGCNAPKSLRVDQLWVWLAAHDTACGRRATNKIARDVAKQWCNDREKSKKWLGRWASEEVTERTDKRLAAVLRLGNKNSRHKKRQRAT